MKCDRCDIGEAVSICATCETKLCADCRITCLKCSKHLCTRHVRLTGSGKRLCSECYELRKKKKRKKKEASALSFASLEQELGQVAHDTKEGPEPDSHSPDKRSSSEAPGALDPDEFHFDPDDQAGDTIKEIDEKRPLLVASGYQPPSKKWLAAAFILFGLSGLYVIISMPNLRDIMWPFDSRGFEIGRNVEPPLWARNTIRQHGSMAKLSPFFQLPAFVIVWGVTLAYLYGLWGMAYGSVRSFINMTLTKASKKKDEQQI